MMRRRTDAGAWQAAAMKVSQAQSSNPVGLEVPRVAAHFEMDAQHCWYCSQHPQADLDK